MGCHWTSALPSILHSGAVLASPVVTGRRHLQARIEAREDWPIMTDVLPLSLHQRNIDDRLQAPHWCKSYLLITKELVELRRLSFLFDVSHGNKWRLYPLDPGLKCRLFQSRAHHHRIVHELLREIAREVISKYKFSQENNTFLHSCVPRFQINSFPVFKKKYPALTSAAHPRNTHNCDLKVR
jgi:hypothetical protein